MKISLGCDHGGLLLKNAIKAHLLSRGFDVLDCGTNAFAYEYAVEYDIDYTYTYESAKYGDCNADDKINMADVLLLRKYLAKWNVTPNLNNADCNADDKINMADVLLLRKYLAKWNVELGPSRAE